MTCEFRIMKDTENEHTPYSIQEVYLDDEGEVCVAHTIDFIVEGKNLNEIRDVLKQMEESLDKPILPTFNEIKDNAQNL